MTENVEKQDAHSPLDMLLGGAPRGFMRHWLTLLILTLAAVGAVGFFVSFVTGENSPYYSAPVERGNIVPRVSERALVHGSGEVDVAAPFQGQVVWVTDKNSGDVAQGEVLAMIDAGQVNSTVAIARSRLAVAKAALDGVKLSAEDAASRLARFESVWNRSGGRAPSLNEIESARVEARRTELGVAAARAELRAAELQLKDQQTRLASAEVRAPIGGTMVRRHVQVGQSVAQSQPLFTIAAGLAPLTIEVPLVARPGTLVRAGTSAQVRFDALPDVPQSATLTPTGNTQSQTVFTIQRPDPRIRPGMIATVEVSLPERRNVLLVPDAALAFEPIDQQQDKQGKRRERIYVLDHGDPRRVYVTVGGSDGKRSEVFANGLQPGDRAIIGWRDARSSSERSHR